MTSQSGGGGASSSLAFGTPLSSQVLLAPAAAVSLSNIPSTYNILLLEYLARDTATGGGYEFLNMQFNGDTAAHYDFTAAVDSNVTSTAETFGATSAGAGFVANGGAPAGLASSGRIWLPEYAGTSFNKNAQAESTRKHGTTAGCLGYGRWSINWRSSVAITSIVLFPASGSFDTGSIFRLYASV